ncbi:MAG: HEAT repeat domain-containing protein [Emcibacteraceae bacterium]|nr:HEAT repeat domain-containing protein [Emcibacteraceae bacterium]
MYVKAKLNIAKIDIFLLTSVVMVLFLFGIAGANAQRAVKSLPVLINELSETHWMNKEGIIRDISRYGNEGSNAGPIIQQLLSDDHWDLRVTAARALGYINYQEAIPELIELLEEQYDWRLVYVSALSLGQLRSQEALGELEHLRQNYWYPPVQDVAANSIKAINRNHPIYSEYNSNFNFYSDFYDYKLVGSNIPECDAGHYMNIVDGADTKLYRSFFPEEIAKLNYKSPYDDYDVDEKTGEYAPNGNIVYEDKYPDVALKVDNGWLTGIARGEWGGELAHIDSDGKASPVLRGDNIYDLYSTNIGLIVLTGMNHIFSHSNHVMALDMDDKGEWSVQKYMTLPGATKSSWKTDKDELLINTEGGSVILTQQGNLKMASCEPLYPSDCNEMVAKLLWIDKANAIEDAEKAIDEGDFNYKAVSWYTYILPGVEGVNHSKALIDKKYTNIEGTSGAICSDQHLRLNRIAVDYAIEYNKFIALNAPNEPN